MSRARGWAALAFAAGCGGAPTPVSAPAPAAPTAAEGAPPAAAGAPLRVGWQTTWATEAQLATLLATGSFLQDQGFAPTFVPFTYGAPLNEAALGRAVDVLFTADQPALVLHSKDPSWGVIGRLMVNRVGLLSPPGGPVAAPADLRGRRLAVPFGAAAHRHALAAVGAAGLQPGNDVELVNLGVEEIDALTQAGAPGGRWGELDAVAVWDPTFAEIEERGHGRLIAQDLAVGLVVMDDRYVAAQPDAPARFMTALGGAIRAMQADPEAAHAAAIQAGLRASAPALRRAAAVEPNLGPAAGPPRLTLDAAELDRLRAAGDFLVRAGIVPAVDVEGALRPTARPAAGGAASPSPAAEAPPADGAQPWAPEGRAP